MQVERWNRWQQQAALLQMHRAEYRDSAEFVELLEQFSTFLAPAVVSRATKMGFDIEVADVVHLLFDVLHRKNSKGNRLAAVAAAADNPWAYIGKAVHHQWARTLWGHRAWNSDIPETLPASTEPVYDGPNFDEVVPKATEIIATRTPRRLRAELESLVWFLATNPPRRLSYERDEREAATEYCPSFNYDEIAAVSNLIWGGRPLQSESSIMGWLLKDLDWNPAESRTHARALKHYEKEMYALSKKRSFSK